MSKKLNFIYGIIIILATLINAYFFIQIQRIDKDFKNQQLIREQYDNAKNHSVFWNAFEKFSTQMQQQTKKIQHQILALANAYVTQTSAERIIKKDYSNSPNKEGIKQALIGNGSVSPTDLKNNQAISTNEKFILEYGEIAETLHIKGWGKFKSISNSLRNNIATNTFKMMETSINIANYQTSDSFKLCKTYDSQKCKKMLEINLTKILNSLLISNIELSNLNESLKQINLR